uniref:Uncharacterized protein n=1 Tax=Arundo donax TaxID=35708 RepID=A0A0A9FQX3_ARUDO
MRRRSHCGFPRRSGSMILMRPQRVQYGPPLASNLGNLAHSSLSDPRSRAKARHQTLLRFYRRIQQHSRARNHSKRAPNSMPASIL